MAVLRHMQRHSLVVYGYTADLYLNILMRKMHNKTQLPDKRTYETFTDENERNRRYHEVKTAKNKVEIGSYDSVSGRIYFIIYNE